MRATAGPCAWIGDGKSDGKSYGKPNEMNGLVENPMENPMMIYDDGIYDLIDDLSVSYGKIP